MSGGALLSLLELLWSTSTCTIRSLPATFTLGTTPNTVPFFSFTCRGRGSGSGPWVMADLENGLWAGNERVNPNNMPLNFPFVTAMVKGGTNGFALKAGDATNGQLTKMFDGPRPNGYQPMKKQGAIILGIGGDNRYVSTLMLIIGFMSRASRVNIHSISILSTACACFSACSNGAIGIFYEGLITSGYTTDAADDAVQANIVAAGYGK